MRILFTSDLHTDLGPRNQALLPLLAARATELRPDVLVLAGDVADTSAAVASALEAFRSVPALRLYLPGNHDLYVEGPGALARGETSREKWKRVLPVIAASAGFTFLGHAPVWYGDVAFVGTPGWYDYTLRDPELDALVHPEQYRRGIWRTQRAFDRGHVLWPEAGGQPAVPGHGSPAGGALTCAGTQPAAAGVGWAGDEWLCEHFSGDLDAQLALLQRARAVVAVVHVLPCLAMVQRGVFAPSAFHDAYLGSERYGERLQKEPRLRAIVTGHLHAPRRIEWHGVTVVSSPVGRVRASENDLAARARSALGTLEIA